MVEVSKTEDALVAAIAAQKVINSCMMQYDCYGLAHFCSEWPLSHSIKLLYSMVMQTLLESCDTIRKVADQSVCASIVGVSSTVMIQLSPMSLVTAGSLHVKLPK